MREVQLRPESTATESAMSVFSSFGITQNRNMKSILSSIESEPHFGAVRRSLEEVVLEENGLGDHRVDFFRNGFQVNDKWVMPKDGVLELTYVVHERVKK